MKHDRRNVVLLWLLALVVGMSLHAPIAGAVSTIYKNALIFGNGASTCTGALGKSCTGANVVYWNSSDGQVHVHLSSGTEFAVPQSAVAGGGGYATVKSAGTPLTQRASVNFAGSGVSCVDNSGAPSTDCTVLGTGIINVKDPPYNCAGNGSTDDTTCLQNAINATSSGGEIKAPNGNYKISSSLQFYDKIGIRFVGAGMRSTSFTWAGATGGVMFDVKGVRESYFGEFTLLGDVAHPTATAIKYNGDLTNAVVSTSNKFERIFIQNYFSYGIRVGQTAYQADQTKYEQLQIYNCSTAGVSIEDANAVAHNFYDSQWNGNAIGITSSLAGTGGAFNLSHCVFKSNTSVDIQTYPGSRGYSFEGVMSETGAVFLQMPQASTNTSVTLTDCSVNGSTSAGPHIRAGAGALNFIGGKYTATGGGTFTVSVGNINGNIANIAAIGTSFPDGNPFTGTNISLYAAIRTMGVKYAGSGGEQGDSYGAAVSELDTAGVATKYTSGRAGAIAAAGGKAAGDLTVEPADGVVGTASFVGGNGANLFLRSSPGGATGGAGPGTAGSVYLYPASNLIFLADSTGATRGEFSLTGTTWFFPQDNDARKMGAAANRFLGLFVDLIAYKVNANIASAATIAPTNYITHITGTTTINTITAPADCASTGNGCSIVLWFDGVAPWSAAGNIIVAGTPTTIGTSVMFTYDNGVSKWSPSRTL